MTTFPNYLTHRTRLTKSSLVIFGITVPFSISFQSFLFCLMCTRLEIPYNEGYKAFFP